MKIIITEEQLKYIIKESDGRKDGTSLKASQNFWDWLRWHEGDMKKKGEPLLKAYKDSVGVWTIGYGHTWGVKAGQTITSQQAERYLAEDIEGSVSRVDKILKVIVNADEMDCLIR